MLTAVFVFGGCVDTREQGERLVIELKEAFPGQISAVAFEYDFLDPPQLYVDIRPPMAPEAERRFLCEQLKPRIESAGGDIDAITSYGWYMSEECPSTNPPIGLFVLLLATVAGVWLIGRRRSASPSIGHQP